MLHADDLPAAVQWHEGMLLAPQHFQVQALRQEELLHFHLSLAAPFHWGVRRLRYDAALLLEGRFRVQELEAVLPDGLVVSHRAERAGQDEALELELGPFTEAARKAPLRLHLAVPIDRRTSTGPARFASVASEPLPDENTGELPLRIPQLRPRLSLFAGLPPPLYARLPLLEVLCEGESFVAGDYIAPPLAVPPESPLGALCDRVSRRIREKAAYLLELIHSTTFTLEPAALEENQRLLHWLVAGLPAFEGVLRSGVSHPFGLYLALCALAGQVAAVGGDLVPPLFPRYEHQDPRGSFLAVTDFIERALTQGISELYTRVPFRQEGKAFAAYFDPDWMNRELVLEVRGRSGSTPRQVQQWVNGCRIGSESHQRMMREKRILGLAREQLQGREGLVPRHGALLWSLEADPAFLVPHERLQLENSHEPPDLPLPAAVSLLVRTRA